jgi:hypothetical protein
VWLDGDADDAGGEADDLGASDAAGDERTFIPISGGSWERRLTRREKTVRSAASLGVGLVIVLVLIGGPGTVLATLSRLAGSLSAVPVAQAAPQATDTIDIPIPADIAKNPLISLAAVDGAQALAYTCWVDEDPKLLGEQVGPLHLATYALGPHLWTLLAPPVAASAGCALVTDMSEPNRVVLVLARAVSPGAPCQLPDLYGSADRGSHWAAIPWPAAALVPCDVRFEMEGGRLYAQGDTPLLPPEAGPAESPRGAAGLLIVTADDGTTWSAADNGLAELTTFSLVALRPGGRLLAQGDDSEARDPTTLWQSDDSGRHWTLLTTLPGTHPRVYASSNPQDTDNGGWGRLYLYARTATAPPLQSLTGVVTPAGASLATGFAEPSWTPSRYQLSGAAAPTWITVALAPDAATTDERPAGDWLRDAGEGPAGSLLFTQPNVSSNIITVTSPFNVLVWNGDHWSVTPQVIPANAFLQSVSWDDGVMRIWVTHKRGILRPVQLLTYTLSSVDIG